MESSEASQDRFLLVICPGCSEPLFPPREQGGSRIACPACGAQVAVPKSDPLPQQAPAPKEYDLHDAEYVPRQTEYIRLHCPVCNTMLYAESHQEGQHIACPDCYTKVKVRRGAQEHQKRSGRPAVEAYGLEQEGAAGKRLGPEHYLSFACPRCQTPLRALREQIGEIIACPDCGTKLRVPAPRSPHLPR